jgi:hypothetical protein
MTKPAPQPVDPTRLVELAQAVVQADHFPFLATIDGDQPCLRRRVAVQIAVQTAHPTPNIVAQQHRRAIGSLQHIMK